MKSSVKRKPQSSGTAATILTHPSPMKEATPPLLLEKRKGHKRKSI
ncbi:hypothetical protein U6B65_11940 [Oscillospiraceae bacterium MB08-C2-2]|nr:hypothetical protein U6B65_11940 [Oscillospiraceae bacterium MB08-C2-2]